jgi:polyphosphate kinase
MSGSKGLPFINRELSWLSFNDRVLQEAADSTVPLLERLRFLGIFSNNRDEFFRVRVATVKRLMEIGESPPTLGTESPHKLLAKIQKKYFKQQTTFESIFNSIINELRKEKILLLDDTQLDERQVSFIQNYFRNVVRPALVPIMLDNKRPLPYLKDKAIYFAIKLVNKKHKHSVQYSLIEIPSQVVPRFLVLPPSNQNERCIIMLDDIIRYCMPEIYAIFDFDVIEAYMIKLTRDAELDIDDDLSQSLVQKMSKSLKKRKKGDPVRFIFDSRMPEDLLNYLLKRLKLEEDDNIIPGGKYHNFKDFMSFPDIGNAKLKFRKITPLSHPLLTGQKSILSIIKKQDVLLSFPYHSFHPIIDLLREAAIDPKVTSIHINLYRVANQSKIINALISAVKNGKSVTVNIELRARFDEENNIKWSKKLQDEGVKVLFGVPGLKVHSKLILISRTEGRKTVNYAHVGTGNFHEGTAKVYGDHSLLTADKRITNEVEKVFRFLLNNYTRETYRHLIISPFNFRRRMNALIDHEIKEAEAGRDARIIIKANNLVDSQMIKKLYEASNTGVKIDLIIRGICSLVPQQKGFSENIRAISIVDRFLEHARVFIFHNSGKPLYFISSADWMPRNIDQRIEVTAPIYDEKIQQEIQHIIDIQLQANTKARILDEKQKNDYVVRDKGMKKIRAQADIYKYLASGKE